MSTPVAPVNVSVLTPAPLAIDTGPLVLAIVRVAMEKLVSSVVARVPADPVASNTTLSGGVAPPPGTPPPVQLPLLFQLTVAAPVQVNVSADAAAAVSRTAAETR